MTMKAKSKTSAALAAELADDPTIAPEVESLIRRSQLVRTLTGLRLSKKLTQKQIADSMKCDQSRVSRIENGYDEDITFGEIVAYAQATGCTTNLLFDNATAPAATRIKQHVLAIHSQLESLAKLAEKEGSEEVFIKKINEFMGEVLLNFMIRFDSSYKRVNALMQVTVPALPEPAPAKSNRNSEAHAIVSLQD